MRYFYVAYILRDQTSGDFFYSDKFFNVRACKKFIAERYNSEEAIALDCATVYSDISITNIFEMSKEEFEKNEKGELV